MLKHRSLVILYVTAVTVIGNFSTNLYVPSFPTMAVELGATVGEIQTTLAVFLATFGIAQLIYGPLSDRFGRRVVLLAGIGVFIAASVGCATASDVGSLIAWRIFQASGACAGQVIARAIVRDLFQRDETARIMAYVGMATAISPATGPLVGGLLHEAFGWTANFYALGLFGVAIGLVSFFFMGETNPYLNPSDRPARLLGGFGTLVRSRAYLGYVLSASWILASIMAWNVGAPFLIIERLGYSPAEYGLFLTGLSVLGYFPGGYLSSRLSPRLGVARTLGLGSLICFASAAAFAAFVALGWWSSAALFGPMVVYSVGMALVFPNATAGAVGAHPRIAGTASAGLGFAHMFLAGLASGTVSLIDVPDPRVFAAVFAAAALFSVLALLLLPRRRGSVTAADESAI